MNIQPGTLCLIINSPDEGKSVTVVAPASEAEVVSWLIHNRKIDPEFNQPGLVWFRLDQEVTWQDCKDKEYVKVPYEPSICLLPIPPLADTLPTTESRELEQS